MSPLSKSPSPPRIRSTTEFARYVGLARTTVSRVLNGQPGLKKKTIERVKKAIAETGFVPNAYALHLKGKRSATVGVCMQNLIQPTLVNKLAVLQQRLRERDFITFIEVVDPENKWDVIRHFLSLRVEAVVFIGYFDEEKMAEELNGLTVSGTPSIVIDHFGIRNANTISLDRARGMKAVMEHLLALGHRDFGLLAYSDDVRSTHDRIQGIREALAAAGLDFDEHTRTLDGQFLRHQDFDYGRSLAKAFAAQRNRPTALVALNDEVAAGAIQGLSDVGLSVPKDISVVGFNNQELCLMTSPKLTSVDQRIDSTVDTAVDLLMAQLTKAGRLKPVVKLIDPLLVVRESTGPVRRP